MNQKRVAPESFRSAAGASGLVFYKDNEIILSKLQKAFFVILSNGLKHSSYRLMQQLYSSDPRKEVQCLRQKGINVQDEWVGATKEVPRHKLYWIDYLDCRKEGGDER